MRISDTRYIDPVCFMSVNSQKSEFFADYNGERYYSCGEGCKQRFQADPTKYIKPKSWWDRWLDKHIRANEEEFGPKGPECHTKRMGPPGSKCD